MFNCLSNCQTVFQSRCPILHSVQQWMSDPVSPQPQQHLLLSVFYFRYPGRYKVLSAAFHLHFSKDFSFAHCPFVYLLWVLFLVENGGIAVSVLYLIFMWRVVSLKSFSLLWQWNPLMQQEMFNRSNILLKHSYS